MFPKTIQIKWVFCEGILPLLNGISVLYWLSPCEPLLACIGSVGSSVLVKPRRPVGALDEARYILKYKLPLLWNMFIARKASKIQASIVVLVFRLGKKVDLVKGSYKVCHRLRSFWEALQQFTLSNGLCDSSQWSNYGPKAAKEEVLTYLP